jgi:ABC-type sugar transport system permease subunit
MAAASLRRGYNSSSLLLFYIYRTAFSFWDMPAASAMTVVLLVILGQSTAPPASASSTAARPAKSAG